GEHAEHAEIHGTSNRGSSLGNIKVRQILARAVLCVKLSKLFCPLRVDCRPRKCYSSAAFQRTYLENRRWMIVSRRTCEAHYRFRNIGIAHFRSYLSHCVGPS